MASATQWNDFLKTVANPDNFTLAEKKAWNAIVDASWGQIGKAGVSYGKFTNLAAQEELETAETEYKTAVEEANAANEARYQAGLGKLKTAEDIYAPGGGWGTGYLEQLEKQKKKDVASGTQALVSSGLANTTMRAALPQAWEGNVGEAARLNLSDLQTTRYTGALADTASFMARKTEAIPDMTLYANLLQSASVGSPTGTTRTSSSYAATPTPAQPTQPIQPVQPATTGWSGSPTQLKQAAMLAEKGVVAKAAEAAAQVAAKAKAKAAYDKKYLTPAYQRTYLI